MRRSRLYLKLFEFSTSHQISLHVRSPGLNADPAAYPSGRPRVDQTTITGILRNPKYTGYMVFGRKRTINGKKRPVPPAEWLWSPQPTHPR